MKLNSAGSQEQPNSQLVSPFSPTTHRRSMRMILLNCNNEKMHLKLKLITI